MNCFQNEVDRILAGFGGAGRASRRNQFSVAFLLCVLTPVVVCWAVCAARAQTVESSVAPYVVAVHVSSHPERSEDALEVHAIKEFVKQRAAQVNEMGGIGGRALEVKFYNDDLEAEKTIANVKAALNEPNLLAMIGVWSSTRGAQVVDIIGESGVPFISEMSVATLFAKYPNIYSLTRSVRSEFNVFSEYAVDNGLKRVAFVGSADDRYTKTFYSHFKRARFGVTTTDSDERLSEGQSAGGVSLVSTYWLDGEIEDNVQGLEAAVADIKAQGADFVFLSIRSEPGAKFLKMLSEAGVELPVFVALGAVQGLMNYDSGRDYGGALVEVAEGGIANLNNERLRQVMRARANVANGIDYKPNQIGYGARYQDLLALVVEGARESTNADVASVRGAISSKLASLRVNRSYWQGMAQNWSFSPDRASAERALIVWRPPGKDRVILAPVQYVARDNAMARVPVLYVHLDMTRVYGIDSTDKSFEAEFFFTLRSQVPVPIEDIEFTNAYRSRASKDPIINIHKVHVQRGEEAKAGVGETSVYRVSGRFRFEPDLARYPFDEQVLSISFQPATTSNAFFLQPPVAQLRKRTFDVDGWNVREHYVGTSDLLIHSVSGAVMDEYVIPYYTFNYTWVMQRQVIDYVLRVIVPLTCILIVSYLAVFIPRVEFNATVAIQVTALLSAIALYFALNQPQGDDATLSDLIFVSSYAIIALMISLSIFEVNTDLVGKRRVLSPVRVAQIFLVPLIAISVLFFLTSYNGKFLG